MEQENKIFFDLSVLLKQNDLNTRSFAEKFVLPAEKYFDMLQGVLTLAPEVDYAIDRFIRRDGDKDSYKALDDMAVLLKTLDCSEHVTGIYSILDAYEKGNWRLAAVHAERMKEKHNGLCSQIEAAKRQKKPETYADPDLSLKEHIRRFDEEEANRKRIILAVDDSAVILKSIAAVLSDEYKVFTLPRPAELEKVLQKITPDLFLLDYLMPDINGFELIPIIRSLEEHTDTPIILLTSDGTIDNVTAALALGACDFVVKPFNPENLRERIAKHIAKATP